jgi:hypothetical protein
VDTGAFYGAAAALCFTLLGFWWVVVEFRHTELTREPGPRRFAFLVSLHFILPGLVSLASLLTTGPLWRVAFGSAGVAGIAALITVMREGTSGSGPLRRIGPLAWVGLPLYALLILFAADPDLAKSTVGLEPLQMEGFLLVFVLLVGIMLAWLLFTYPAEEDVPASHGER